jgi:hypothetical protein
LAGHAIPTYHLDYPREYQRLPDVQAAILGHATRLKGQYGI